MSDEDAIRETLTAWQEEPCTGGHPTMPVWPGKHGGCVFCDQKIASEAADWMDRISRPMIVCPECGNKRCPKAQWHRNECTRSNNTGQPYDYPAEPSPADLAYLLAELDKARAASVVHVSHYDMEARAVHFNEGYETAMSQHLADDPSAAEDWLNEKLAEAWREGFSAGYADGTDTGPTSPDNPYRKEAP